MAKGFFSNLSSESRLLWPASHYFRRLLSSSGGRDPKLFTLFLCVCAGAALVSYPDYSWDDQDFEELQEAVLGEDPEEPEDFDTDFHELDCPICEQGNWDKCNSCGHDPYCEESDCRETIHAVRCSGCHASEDFRAGKTCPTCGHLEFCLEPDCNESTHDFEVNPRRIASSEELELVRKLGELRDQKRSVEEEINRIREKLINDVFSSDMELFESVFSEKPLAWASYRESHTISSADKSKLKSLFPEVFQRFFRKREVYTIYLETPSRRPHVSDAEGKVEGSS